jgi:nondiscriminating aspartyl-tRNA synthetase
MMMERIRTVEAAQYVGQQVYLQGWLHNVRRLGGVNFILLRDGWGTIQAVTETAVDLEPLAAVGLESVIGLSGLVVATSQTAAGLELQQPQIEVITPVTADLPLTLHKPALKATLPVLLDQAVLANRHPLRRAVFRLAAAAMAGFRQALQARHFTEIQSPKLVAAATEGGANVFRLDYFGGEAFLAQSPQFYKQMMVGVFERVYEVGPVFRAEPHDTSRHVNEYVSLDVELGFIEDHFTVMELVQTLLAAMLDQMGQTAVSDLALLNLRLPAVPQPIPHIHFREAKELVWQQHRVDERAEPDLSPQEERWLGEWAKAEYGSDFLFVTGYPMVKRPFYTHPDPADPTYSNSFDLLFRGLELITGGQRLHRYQDYRDALAQACLPETPFTHYLSAFRYGMPPHGGFAIGLERLLMQLLGVSNLRLTTLFPRDQTRLVP